MCDVDIRGVISTPRRAQHHDVPGSPRGSLDAYVVRKLGHRSATWTGRCGASCCAACTEPEETVRVALVGKYVDLPRRLPVGDRGDPGGGFAHWARTEIVWVHRTRAPPTPVRSTSLATSTPS